MTYRLFENVNIVINSNATFLQLNRFYGFRTCGGQSKSVHPVDMSRGGKYLQFLIAADF